MNERDEKEQRRINRILGLRLRSYRETNKLTLADVAKRLGISYQAVQRWEGGNSRPGSDKLMRLAWIYGVTLEDLLKGEDTLRPGGSKLSVMLITQLSGLVSHSKERANRIYELAMRDMGVPGVLHSFMDDATELYLEGKMSDEGLYVHAKSQIERIAKLLSDYDAKNQ